MRNHESGRDTSKKPRKPRLRVEYVDHGIYSRSGKRFISQIYDDGVLRVSTMASPAAQRDAIESARRSWKRTEWRPFDAQFSHAKRTATLCMRQTIGARVYLIWFASRDAMIGTYIDLEQAEIIVSDLVATEDLVELLLEAREHENGKVKP